MYPVSTLCVIVSADWLYDYFVFVLMRVAAFFPHVWNGFIVRLSFDVIVAVDVLEVGVLAY